MGDILRVFQKPKPIEKKLFIDYSGCAFHHIRERFVEKVTNDDTGLSIIFMRDMVRHRDINLTFRRYRKVNQIDSLKENFKKIR